MFRKLPSNSSVLLHEIVSSANSVDMLQQRFEECKTAQQDNELRNMLRELQQEGYLDIFWADNVPYCVNMSNTARTAVESATENERSNSEMLYNTQLVDAQNTLRNKVFISHSTVDYNLVHLFTDLLNKIEITNDEIFCTSISGALEGGVSFIDQIKNAVFASKVVVFLMSERFFLSYFCLAELGAAWANNPSILPIIVPPITADKEFRRTPLSTMQVLNISSERFVDSFIKDLSRKGVIANNYSQKDIIELANEFNPAVKKELGILRKDQDDFYVARIVENHQRKNYDGPFWRLNGLLDEETDSDITEHWVYAGPTNITGKKLQFKIKGELLKSRGSEYRVFELKEWYELP